jgi:Kdo2-lipid IVA lauroyltransferase/acyltransferase
VSSLTRSLARVLVFFGFWCTRVLTFLLPVAALLWWARVSSGVIYRFLGPVRRAHRHNARYLLPDADPAARQAMGKAVFQSFARFFVEMLTAHRRPVAGEEGYAMEHMRGGEHWEAARALGKGVIALTLHMGNYELGARLVARLHPRVAVVFNRDPIGIFEQLRSRHRTTQGIEEIVIDDSPLFGVSAMRVLREDGVVVACADQGFPHERGRSYDFLGGRAPFIPWPARVALATGAPLLPSVVVRDETGNYTVEMASPVLPRPGVDADQLMQELVCAFEPFVRRYPDQWLIIHRYWEHDPDTSSGLRDAAGTA